MTILKNTYKKKKLNKDKSIYGYIYYRIRSYISLIPLSLPYFSHYVLPTHKWPNGSDTNVACFSERSCI